MGDLIPGPRDLVAYLHSIRVFILVVTALFLVSLVAGYAVPIYTPGVSDTLISGLKDKADRLKDQPKPMMMLGIFANNAFAAFLSLLLGIFAGVFTLFFVASNGLTIGIVLEISIAKLGLSDGVFVFLLGILPHGVIELPAVLVSTAIGLKLGYAALRLALKGDKAFLEDLKKGILIFLFWIIPALFVAAIIETYVTGALLEHFVHAPIFK